jgi:uncharacterized protein YcbK (DUF882 family)
MLRVRTVEPIVGRGPCKRPTGVAANSLHPRGMAVDLRVPARPLLRVRAAALALRRGGVGDYPESDFVHIDVGRVRRW